MLKSLALMLLAIAGTVGAQTPPESSLPPSLKDWRGWVLKDLDYRACPFLAGHAADAQSDFICAWPGRLTLAAGADGATFSVHWRVEANSWVPLPGDADQWPQQVTINAQRQPTLEHDEHPALWLTPGNYEISGKIPWRERPQALSVPQDIGLVTLTVDGKPISPLQRQGTQLTLGRSAAAAPEADSLDVRVYRKLADGVPANLTTQLLLRVSGQAREEVLGPVLPEGFAPLSLEGAWPARLDADGKMHVQVQPGSETLILQARGTTPLAAITAHLPPAPWPKQEIWSYAPDAHLRVTAASSAVQVDPRQSEVPQEWQALPAFALGDAAKLTIEERSRGLAADEANRLTLQREAWLDFDGGGWYARDHLGGTLAQGWRFDVAAPFTLEQATARNSRQGEGGEALLITSGAKPELTGVEWRTPNVDLAAGVRVAARAAMPVAGWQESFDNVQATLHFPFGYKLLAAPGADSASGSWIAGWTLLDVFLCAIVALLAWRLFGLVGAAIVVAYLLLGYQESGSPLWSLALVLGLALIVRALPEGKLQRVTARLRVLALIVLVLIALPFVTAEVRDALYPQLEEQDAFANYGGAYRHRVSLNAGMPAPQNAPAGVAGGEMKDEMRQEEAATPMSVPVESPPPPPSPVMRAPPKILEKMKTEADKKSGALQTIEVTGSNITRADLIDHYSQNTVVQTGKGLPSWNLGSTAWLSWSGPVVATQSVHLLIAPPWLVRPLRIVLVALLAWLIMRLFRTSSMPRPMRGAALSAGAIVLCGMICAPHAQAQSIPSEELLQQLRQRLIEAPKCAPACVNVAEAQVSASGDSISVVLEAHAGERVALPLPGDATEAMLKSVQVDGIAADAIARDGEGTAWVALGRGVHRVQIDFTATADKLALAFPLKPARMLFAGKGWDASGLDDDRLLSGTLSLARAREDGGEKMSVGAQQFPPYVEVTRNLTLGLEWSANTFVRRLAPKTGGFTVRVPILPGEHVVSRGLKVIDGHIEAALADDATDVSWEATLDKGNKLTLTAPALADRAEVWRVTVSPTWHVEFAGVPGVGLSPGENPNDYRNFEFHPLPGETLTMNVTRPEVAQGAQRAIDAVNLHSETGQHASTHVLNFTLRASQGGDQAITLPKDAEVLSVTRDNETLNLRTIDGKLTLPVAPGAHRYGVRFRDTNAVSTLVRTPMLALGMPAANISVIEQLPGDRWLLAAWGPSVGPAVLYWGELVVMILVAYALARTRRTRLKFHQWLLLGFGFSTFSWIALAVVVAWLFAFDWRARSEMPAPRWRFNLLQVGLVVLTVVALIALASAIPQGLLGQPDMHVTGNGSYASYLQWFADRSVDALPQASALSLPLWVYKVLMLAWALWLANAVIGWLRDGFAAWTNGGYWRAAPQKSAEAQPAQPAP